MSYWQQGRHSQQEEEAVHTPPPHCATPSAAHLQPVLQPRSPNVQHQMAHHPHHQDCDFTLQHVSPNSALQYAEQVGWLSNRSEELQAALDFQTERATSLHHESESLKQQLQAERERAQAAVTTASDEHATELQRVRNECEERAAALQDQLQAAQANAQASDEQCRTHETRYASMSARLFIQCVKTQPCRHDARCC